MDLFNGDKSSFMAGFVVGVGTGFTARELIPALGGVAKPLFKNTLKSSLLAFDKGRESLAHFGETIQDLMAEARMEVEQENLASEKEGAEKDEESRKEARGDKHRKRKE